MPLWARTRARARRDVNFVNFVGLGDPMKQINVWPMLIMLIVVVLLIAWFGGYLS
jgi:hypothetical protein